MSLTLTDLRQRLRLAGRNTNDPSYYKTVFLDEAIDRLCARFLRVTRCVKLAFTVNVTAIGNTVDFSSLSGFLPDRIERMRIDTATLSDKADLNHEPVEEVLNGLTCAGTSSSVSTYCGQTLIGFTGSTTAKLYPAPAANGTITGTYSPLQVPWTLGTQGAHSTSNTYVAGDVVSSSGTLYSALQDNATGTAINSAAGWLSLGAGTLVAPGSIVTVIPEGLAGELISTGGPPMLQRVDPEHQAFVGPAYADYLAFEASCSGIGSISGKSSTRSSLRGSGWRGGAW